MPLSITRFLLYGVVSQNCPAYYLHRGGAGLFMLASLKEAESSLGRVTFDVTQLTDLTFSCSELRYGVLSHSMVFLQAVAEFPGVR